MPAEEPVVSQSYLATVFRVTVKTVQTWDKQGLRAAARVDGEAANYNLAAAVEWKLLELKGVDPAEKIRLRKLEADTARAELDLRKARGELVQVSTHRSRLQAIVERLRARLTAAPGAWAPQLVGLKTVPEALQRGRQLVNELLDSLSASAAEIIPDEDQA